ncbi:hypothetical protein [Streptomyces phaeolivaceus]|uniref:hypothetical protein n=1 Tax=Streptomyces phaeolivaceus TaxID=2653200 RepID=UPI001869C80E|nr:hypothetical protein [Streptomyces phaeolivaceus]
MHFLAGDAGDSQATGYRYLHEGIDVLADQAPGPARKVLDRCRRVGVTHVILDGTLIEPDRLTRVRDNSNDLLFSQKRKAFGGNGQFLAVPDGTPLWVSGVEPGSTPDITAARIHALPTSTPARRPKGRSEQALHADTQTTNNLIRDLRALGEREAAVLKQRWRTL